MFASLILALYDNGSLIHVGRVGTGFNTEFLEEFAEKLKEIEVSEPIIPGLRFNRKAHWVKPYYVCEIEFLELTSDMKFRAPVFLRLRDDKSIEECTVDQLR
jgi:bifunctional non-homologous end joining protein LigD